MIFIVSSLEPLYLPQAASLHPRFSLKPTIKRMKGLVIDVSLTARLHFMSKLPKTLIEHVETSSATHTRCNSRSKRGLDWLVLSSSRKCLSIGILGAWLIDLQKT